MKELECENEQVKRAREREKMKIHEYISWSDFYQTELKEKDIYLFIFFTFFFWRWIFIFSIKGTAN